MESYLDLVLEIDDGTVGRLHAQRREAPRRVLERQVIDALRHPPCVVAFSGGRDSSAMLALAAHCARHEGLPLPVPATHRFDGIAGPSETTWQERVVRYLALDDWIVHRWRDEMDLLGPYARRVLRRWGPVYPHNAHFLTPLLEDAAGGTLVTGIGGDEIFCALSGFRAVARALRAGDAACALGVLPEPVWLPLAQRRLPPLPWLTTEADQIRRRETARRQGAVRYRWAGVVDAWHHSPDRRSSRRTDTALAAWCGTSIASPLESRDFLESLASDVHWLGYRSRAEITRRLFSDVLPEAVVVRADKAYFNQAFFSAHSRSFVAAWDGSHLDRRLALEQPLRAAWSQRLVDARTFALLQQLWCESNVEDLTRSRAQEWRSTARP